tara:strand:- start:2348 stop:2557 length:210 start_codon:yes stop_codon:yes gene_type:complete
MNKQKIIKNIIELNNERGNLREKLMLPKDKAHLKHLLERIDSVTAEMSMEIVYLENAVNKEQALLNMQD